MEGESEGGRARGAQKGNRTDKNINGTKSVPLWKVFQFTDALDIIMMLLAILMSVMSGVAASADSFLIGRLFTVFISYNTAQSFSFVVSSFPNNSCSTNAVVQFLANSSNSSQLLFCDISSEGNVFSSASNFICDPSEQLIKEANSLSIYFVLLAVGTFVTDFLTISLWNVSAIRQSKRMRIAFYKSITRQEIGWFETTDTSELGPLFIKGVENIQAGIGDQAGLMIRDVSIFLGGLLWALFINWKLTIVMFSLLPLVSVLSALNIKSPYMDSCEYNDLSKAVQTFTDLEESAYLKAGSVAAEVLAAIRTVVAFGGEEREEKRYHVHAQESEKEAVKAGLSSSAVLGALFFLALSMFGVAFWYGSVLIVNCEIVGGDALTVLTLILFGSLALGGALPQIKTFLSASASAGEVFSIIDLDNDTISTGMKPKVLNGQIQFFNVNFSYPSRSDVQVLDNMSFTVEPGQTVALVGPSGNGKSTILQLIQQFYQPSSGEILLDGVGIQDIDRDWLRSHIGMVTQEPVLFNTTIYENIRLGKPEATKEEIVRAAHDANAHSFIVEFGDGYDTYVGEGGIQLSGGQKQRIAIARALVRDPKILLLDEATSALDTISEGLVQSALEKARIGRTSLIVAHRLSTVQNADIILCINKGTVVEIGSHTDLMEMKGLYYNLVGTQLQHRQAELPCDIPRRTQSFGRGAHKPRRRVRRSKSVTFSGWTDYDHLNVVNGSISTLPEVAEESGRFRDILQFVKPDWPIVLTGVLFYGAIGACYPIIGALLAAINVVYSETDQDTITKLSQQVCIGFLLLSFLAGLFYFGGSIAVKVSGERLTTRLRTETFRAIMKKDMSWFDREENCSGNLINLLSVDTKNVKEGTGILLGVSVLAAVSIIFSVGVCLSGSWQLTLVLFLAIPMIIIAHQIEFSQYTKTHSKNDDSFTKAANLILETKDNMKTVLSLGVEEYLITAMKRDLGLHLRKSVGQFLRQGFFYALAAAMVLLVYSAGCRLAAHLITIGSSNIGGVLRVFASVIVTAKNVTYALASTPSTSKAFESGRKLSVLLKCEDSKLTTKMITPRATFGHVVGNNVHFSYPCRPDVEVLQGLNVSITPGQTLALVGSSGGGKSTIISLIQRFYDISLGAITLDGLNITTIDCNWLRSQIGYVPQEPVLFNTTIADNIRYGALFRDVSEEEIAEVAKACHIHDFIESLPQGYNTNVGIGGNQLSGGQKQRIAIARALVRNPKILLLDEATSSLDAESEQAVQQALKTARVGRTTIVVAHRLSTIQDADCIAVVENGQVTECGTHAELMVKRGAYHNLVNKKDPA